MTRHLLVLFASLAALTGPVKPQNPAGTTPEPIVIEGRVVDLRGEPVPAAKVSVVHWADPATPVARTVADGDGYFRLGKVPRALAMQVHARADGFCTGVAYVGATTRVVTVRLQHAVVVRGTLRNRKGEPVADTPVRAEPLGRALSYEREDGRTDADGRFVLAAVPLAPVLFSAWVDGEGVASVARPVDAACEITLTPGDDKTTRLSVQVSGLPAGAGPVRLSVLPYTGGSLTYLPPPHDRPLLDADGRWSIDRAPDWEYTVYPSGENLVFAPREIRVKPGLGPHELTFTATASGASTLLCKAIVHGLDDKPAAGIALAMRAPNGGNTCEATSDENGAVTFASPLAKGTEAVIYTTDGRWVVDQKKADEHTIDRFSMRRHEFQVDPEQVLQLRVIPACSAEGRLLLPDGRPAAFVRVGLEESSATRWPRWMGMASATTDREGRYRFTGVHHLPDEVRVRVESPSGFVEGAAFLLNEPGAGHACGDLTLAPPAVIEGVVLDAQQQPVPGMRVWLRDWDMQKGQQASGSVVETLTDREGRYRFLGVPQGGAWLQLLHGVDERAMTERAVEPFEVEAGKTYTFDLQVTK